MEHSPKPVVAVLLVAKGVTEGWKIERFVA